MTRLKIPEGKGDIVSTDGWWNVRYLEEVDEFDGVCEVSFKYADTECLNTVRWKALHQVSKDAKDGETKFYQLEISPIGGV